MKSLEVFISAPADVQEEQVVIERVIRSIAPEFEYAVSASHSSRLQRLESEDLTATPPARGPSQGVPLRVCFWEHADAGIEERPGQVPNPGQFDLVVCLVWSRLGPTLAPKFVAPDGSVPGSATEYEVAWALDQARITPGFPALQVYRNRSVPDVPLEPREAREASFRRWDAVQEFFAKWQERGAEAFAQSCRDYRSLEELEALFRTQFRLFLSERADRDSTRRPSVSGASSSTTPFRGLYPFDHRHATLFHGRTKATRELLTAFRKQAAAGRPFVLVLGPNGSGKSSLVRAGVVPLLVRAGVTGDHGLWRRTVTRPGAVGSLGNPIEALVTALVDATTAPGLDPLQSRSPQVLDQTASELRQDPGAFARRIEVALDDVSLDRLDRRLDQQERDFTRAGRREAAELATRPRLSELGAKARLVLVVDQFDELFTAGFPLDVQRLYVAALVALAQTRRVFVIATLLSDLYNACQQFPELIEITTPSGRYDLPAPTAEELGQIVRWRAENRGLRFERHARTGQVLDDFMVQAALASADALPQLEHLLTRLYERQAGRGDGLLRWSDYAELGGFEGALAQHAESVFASLEPAEQAAADFVLQQLAVTTGANEAVRARTISARALVSARAAGDPRPAAVKGFVDCFLKEGFLRTDKDPRGETVVTVSHDVLLRKWTRARLLALAHREPQPQAPPAEDLRRPMAVSKTSSRPPPEPRVSKVDGASAKPKASPVSKRRWLQPWDAVTRKFQVPKVPQDSAHGRGERLARLAAMMVPILALLAAVAFAIHLWLEKQAQEEARQRRADQAIAAALGPRHQEVPAPTGMAPQPETAAVSPSAAGAGTGKDQPDSQRTVGVTVPNGGRVEGEPGVTPGDAGGPNGGLAPVPSAPAPAPMPSPASSPEKTDATGRAAPRGMTPSEPVNHSTPLIPELTAKKQRGSLPSKSPEGAASPGALAGQAGGATNPSPTEAPHPAPKALSSELNYSRAPLPPEDLEKEPGNGSSVPPEDPSKRNRWARRTMPAPNQSWAPPAVSPTPAPSAPMAAPPTDDRSIAAADEARLRALARDYVQSVENNDVSALDRFFADQVNFYGQGSIGKAQVQDATQRYHEVWPIRKWTVDGKPRIVGPTGSSMYQILQPFRWMVSNGFQSRRGDATLQLLVEKDANGEFRIVAVRQLNR